MRLFVGAVIALACAPSLPAAFARDLPPIDEVNKQYGLLASSVQDLALPAGDPWAPFAVTLDLEGQPVELVLEPHRVRSPDFFQVQLMDGEGRVTPVDAPAPTTYKGSILTIPGARVRAALVNHQLHAVITLPSGEGWTVQPLSAEFPDSGPAAHLVYRGADVIPVDNRCPVGDGSPDDPGAGPAADQSEHAKTDAPAQSPGSSPAARGPTLKICEIAFDVDFEYYTLLGSNVTTVVNDIENVMNSIESIYEGESITIQFEVTTINVRTANAAPYLGVSGASSLLSAFQNEWNGANPSLSVSIVRRDVAHLFTNKSLTPGGVLGIAYLSGACTSGTSATSYGLSKSRWSATFNNRLAVTAHEIGHNMSATHCDTGIGEACSGLPTCQNMCSAVGSCGGSLILFGACSAGQIISFRDGAGGCMSLLSPPITSFPFFDGFDTGIQPANWVWNYNAQGTLPAAALQPAPTPNFACALNAQTVVGITLRDQLRSNFFNLQGAAANTEVSFRWSKSNVPAGATLAIEYWANTLRWVTLGTLTSDGITGPGWTLQKFTVPAAGLFNEFRIRFRVADVITTTNQLWYVDNFRVGSPLPINCNLADITEIGGTAEAPGSPDNQLTVDDVIVFTNLFGDGTGCPGTPPCSLADVTGIGGGGSAPDGELTVDDVIEFFNAFSDGC